MNINQLGTGYIKISATLIYAHFPAPSAHRKEVADGLDSCPPPIVCVCVRVTYLWGAYPLSKDFLLHSPGSCLISYVQPPPSMLHFLFLISSSTTISCLTIRTFKLQSRQAQQNRMYTRHTKRGNYIRLCLERLVQTFPILKDYHKIYSFNIDLLNLQDLRSLIVHLTEGASSLASTVRVGIRRLEFIYYQRKEQD